MTQPRRHPDLFTEEEAAIYLHLDNPRTIQTLREQNRLNGKPLGKSLVYHRLELDAIVINLFPELAKAQEDEKEDRQSRRADSVGLKLAGGR